jgi:transposase-like protein
MERRKWKPEEKLAIVLESLRNETPIAEICRKHQISQTQFYKWRDKFLQGAKEYLEYGGQSKEIYQLKQKIKELERIIGRLAIENEILKKQRSS